MRLPHGRADAPRTPFGRVSPGAGLLLVSFLFATSCTERERAPAPRATATPSGSANATGTRAETRTVPASSVPERVAPEPIDDVVEAELSDAGLPGLALGELSDVGPAAPATAFEGGVVFVTKDDRVLVARPAGGASSRDAKVAPIDEPATAFAPLARGPSVAAGAAYWVSHGRLVRRALRDGAPLEIVANDARGSTRTSAAELAGHTVVAYLGRPDHEGTARARISVDGQPSIDLTPEGAGASSVALTRHGDGLLAVSIDGRSGMTPVHARRIRLAGGRPELEPDVVVWVAGPAQTWTEVFLGSSRGKAFLHLPIERDVTHFGLATVPIGERPAMDAAVSFFDYENGLNLAPAAAAELCGRAHVSFVRPIARAPRSPQELLVAEAGTRRVTNAANARGFAAVSLGPTKAGGYLAYVADGRTWVRGLACR